MIHKISQSTNTSGSELEETEWSNKSMNLTTQLWVSASSEIQCIKDEIGGIDKSYDRKDEGNRPHGVPLAGQYEHSPQPTQQLYDQPTYGQQPNYGQLYRQQ